MIYGDRTFEEDETKYPDITASLQASNVYIYCTNNPVKYVDSNGLYVYIVGGDAAAEAGFAVSADGYLVFDDHGNIGIMGSVNGGAGFLGAGVSVVKGMFYLDNINDLQDISLTATVSGGEGVCMMASMCLSDSGEFFGTVVGVGGGLKLPLPPVSASATTFSVSKIQKITGVGPKPLAIIKAVTGFSGINTINDLIEKYAR